MLVDAAIDQMWPDEIEQAQPIKVLLQVNNHESHKKNGGQSSQESEVYEFAQKFDLAITIHSGIGSANLKRILLPHFFSIFRASLVNCFHAIVLSELPKKFPGVRWGIIEGRAGWLPWIVSDLQKRFHKQGKRIGPDLLKDNNIFVTLELEDDLSEIIKCVGDDNLIIGTDYGHCDTSAEIEALRILAENGKVPKSSVDKILGPNAERLYKI